MSGSVTATVAGLADRVRALTASRDRVLLGIAGPPAAGKSTLAAALVSALAPDAALVGLDGFHLSNAELDRLGRRERKGAVDTFDAGGFASLVHRLADRVDPVVYAAVFERGVEESIACSVAVPREVPVVVVEGNWLLVDEEPWTSAAARFDEVWYLDPPEDLRLERLIGRHVAFGRSPAAAAERAHGSDGVNAALIAGTRPRATLTVRLDEAG